MPKLDPISENVIRVPESIDTNAADKPLARATKIKHDRDTAAGQDDISSWVDENDKTARAAAEAAKHALDWISASGGQSTQWADATDANIFAGYCLRYLPVGRDPGSQIPFETIDGVLNNAGSWNIYVTLPASIPVSRIRIQNRLTADDSVQATLPAAGSEWAATSFAGLHEYSRAYRLVLSSDPSAPEMVVLAGGSKLVLQISNNGEGDVLEELEDRKTIGLTDSPVLRTLSQTKITDTFVDTGQPLNAAEDATIWAIDFNNVLYQFSPVSVGELGGSKVAGTDTINGENEIELGAFGAVVRIDVNDGVNLGFAAKSPIEGTVNVRQVVVGPDSDGIDRQIAILQDLTQDIQVPPSSTGWVDATLDSQGGIHVRPDSNIISPPADLAEAQALTDSDFALRIDTVGQSHVVIRLPAGYEPGQARTHLGNAWGAAISEGLNTFIYLGQSTDRAWDLYASPTEYGSGVAWIYLQVTASAAHVGKTIYRGTLTHEGVIDAIGEGGIETSELAGEAVTGNKLAGKAVTRDKLSDTLQQEISDVQTKAIAWRDLFNLTADTHQVRSTAGVSDAITFQLVDLVPKRPYEVVLNATVHVTDEDAQNRSNNHFAPYLVFGGTAEHLLVDVGDRKDINGYSSQEVTFITTEPVVIWPEHETLNITLRFRAEHDFSYVIDSGSVLLLGQGISATSTQQALYDFDDLPDPTSHTVREVVISDDSFYKLGITDATESNQFDGTVGPDSITLSHVTWRGITSGAIPTFFTPNGSWQANPGNTLVLLIASDDARMQMVMKLASYEEVKGSDFDENDKIAIEVTLQSGDVDRAVFVYHSAYRRDEEEYIHFQATRPEGSENFELWSAPAGTTLSAKLFTVDGNGDATTTPFFTHGASVKHWLKFVSKEEQNLAKSIATLRGNPTLKDLSALPDPDDFEAGDLVIAEDEWHKLAVTSNTTENLFEAALDHPDIATGPGGVIRWRGITNGPVPIAFDSVIGTWTVNPDNALTLVMASNDGRMRVAMKRSSYVAAKGSALDEADKIAVEVILPDNVVDRAVLSYLDDYTYRTTGDEVFIEWQGTTGTEGENFHLNSADQDITTIAIRFFTVDGDGNATTTHLLTHTTGMKHWILFNNIDDAASRAAVVQAQQTADAAQARLDAIADQIDGTSTLLHSQTYDENTALIAPASGHGRDYAVSTTFSGVKLDDLIVVDWKKCDHLNDHSEHVVPGSDTDVGRMYFYARDFDTDSWNGEFIYALDKALQDNGSPDELNSWIVGAIQHNGTSLTFGLHLQQSGPRSNHNLMSAPGFSLSISIYRNTSPSVATEGSIRSQLRDLAADISDLSGRVTYQTLEKSFNTAAAVHSIGDITAVPDHSYWRIVRIYAGGGMISTFPWPAGRIELPSSAGALSTSHPGIGPVTVRATNATGLLAQPYYAQVFKDAGKYKINFRGLDGGQYTQAYLEKIEIDYVT